jgi:hypothetical protein
MNKTTKENLNALTAILILLNTQIGFKGIAFRQKKQVN